MKNQKGNGGGKGLSAKRKRQERIRTRVEERKQRQTENYLGPLTPKKARRQAKGLAKLEFGPTERQLRSEIAGSAKREGDIGGWYGALAADQAAGAANAQQAFGTAEAATTQRLGEQNAQADTTLKGLAEKDASLAKLVGGPTNAAGIDQFAQAAAAASRERTSLAAPLATIRADNVASYAPRVNAVRMKGIEARQGERERRRKIQQDLGATQREKGMSVGKNYLGLREQDQTFSTQKQAFATKEGYNKALENQSRLGLKSSLGQAKIEKQATEILAASKNRGATAQEEVARLYSEGKGKMAKALENVARIQGKNSSKGGYTVKEAESLAKTAGKEFKSPGEVVDYLTSRGVKRGQAKKAAHSVWHNAHTGG